MRFDLVDLQLFIAVADSRSITRGADRAHLALASASARIKGLEDALGVVLFKRGRRGVELTAAGESLLDHARLVIHNIDNMRGDLARFGSRVGEDRRGRALRAAVLAPRKRFQAVSAKPVTAAFRDSAPTNIRELYIILRPTPPPAQ